MAFKLRAQEIAAEIMRLVRRMKVRIDENCRLAPAVEESGMLKPSDAGLLQCEIEMVARFTRHNDFIFE